MCHFLTTSERGAILVRFGRIRFEMDPSKSDLPFAHSCLLGFTHGMNCEPQRMAGQEYLLRRPLPIEVKNYLLFHGEDLSHAMYVESAQRTVARLGTVENSSVVRCKAINALETSTTIERYFPITRMTANKMPPVDSSIVDESLEVLYLTAKSRCSLRRLFASRFCHCRNVAALASQIGFNRVDFAFRDRHLTFLITTKSARHRNAY